MWQIASTIMVCNSLDSSDINVVTWRVRLLVEIVKVRIPAHAVVLCHRLFNIDDTSNSVPVEMFPRLLKIIAESYLGDCQEHRLSTPSFTYNYH